MKQLIQDYLQAKKFEEDAKAKRVQLGDMIAKKLGTPEEGQKTYKADGYSVVVRQNINRTVDWDAFDRATDGCSDPAPVKTKRELDMKGLSWYAEEHPKRYSEMVKAITSKPGRPSVTVKEQK